MASLPAGNTAYPTPPRPSLPPLSRSPSNPNIFRNHVLLSVFTTVGTRAAGRAGGRFPIKSELDQRFVCVSAAATCVLSLYLSTGDDINEALSGSREPGAGSRELGPADGSFIHRMRIR